MEIRFCSMISAGWPHSVIIDWAMDDVNQRRRLSVCSTGGSRVDRWATNAGRAGGNCKQKGKRHSVGHFCPNPRGRMRAISTTMSRELRHEPHDSMQRDGIVPLKDLLDTEDTRELFASQEDIRRIVRGGGENSKFRFEMGMMGDRETVSIREAQGHIESSGVADGIFL